MFFSNVNIESKWNSISATRPDQIPYVWKLLTNEPFDQFFPFHAH